MKRIIDLNPHGPTPHAIFIFHRHGDYVSARLQVTDVNGDSASIEVDWHTYWQADMERTRDVASYLLAELRKAD